MRSLILAASLLATGCTTTIKPGEVGVRRSFGKLATEHRNPGLIVHSPIGRSYVKVPVQTQNMEVRLALPSQEGVNVEATLEVARAGGLPVIASGGITDMGDIKRLCAVADDGIVGAITGRAIYEGTLDLAAAQRYADGNAG